MTKFSNLSKWFNLFGELIVKFVNIVENGITKVILDLEAVTIPAFKLESRDTVCVFEGTHDFDFTIVNEFLSSQHESTLSYIARTLIDMRRCIINSGHSDAAAEKCVGELRLSMYELFDTLPMSPTGNLFNDLYNFSAKYITPNEADSCCSNDTQMLVAASLLSALCVMVIHNFKTHFTDVSDPLQILYPVFEETIRDCGVDGAKEFVEGYRILVSNMDDDRASWVIEGIYINDCMLRKHNDCMLRKHKLPSPIEKAVIEHLTQRILSSKSYHSNKRMKEMREINKAEEQQRMKNNKISDTPLTDDEFKEFSKKIEHGRLLPVREIFKDTLDIIHFTVKYFLKYSVPEIKNIEKDSTRELIMDSWEEIISNAKSQVDEMNDDELMKIARHANCVQDAFDLVRMHIPVGMYQCSQLIVDREIPRLSAVLGARKFRGYLRKIFDIYDILNTPTGQYMGADIEYFSSTSLEEFSNEFSGVKGTKRPTSSDLGYEIYNTELRHPYYVYLNEQPLDKVMGDPDIFLKWADENVKNINKDEFFEFLTRREPEISAYTKLKQSYPNLTADDKDEICKVFYRWFLKEQAS